MIQMQKYSYLACLCVFIAHGLGCSPLGMPKVLLPTVEKAGANAISPPTFVEVVKEKEHSDFSLTIAKMNLPQTTLREALIAAMPFPVTLRPDRNAHLDQPLAVRIADKTTLKQFLSHIAELTDYQLNYMPQQKIIKIVSRLQKTWHLPALVGRYQTSVSLGESSAEDTSDSRTSSDGDTQTEQLTIRSQYRSHQQTEWEAVVQQAHCLIGTHQCPQGALTQDGSSLFTYPEQGMITAISTPRKIAALDQWLSELERNINRFVRLQIALVSIRKRHTDSRGVDFRAILASGNNNLTVESINKSPEVGIKEFVIGGVLRSGNFSLDGVLNLIKENTDSEIVHHANIIVSSGETAIINATERFYFASGSEIIPGDAQNNQVVSTNLQEQSVGIKLAVTPRFLKPGSEIMSIRAVPSISKLISLDPIQSNGRIISQAPRVSSNNFVSHSILRNGHAIIIGGLTSQDSSTRKQEFPGSRAISALRSRSGEFIDSELAIIISAQEVEV